MLSNQWEQPGALAGALVTRSILRLRAEGCGARALSWHVQALAWSLHTLGLVRVHKLFPALYTSRVSPQ